MKPASIHTDTIEYSPYRYRLTYPANDKKKIHQTWVTMRNILMKQHNIHI